MTKVLSNELKALFKNAVDNNVLIYDKETKPGTLSKRSVSIIREVGIDNNWGCIKKIHVPSDVKTQKSLKPLGRFLHLFSKWTGGDAVIECTKELNIDSGIMEYADSLSVGLVENKQCYGIVEYDNHTALVAI